MANKGPKTYDEIRQNLMARGYDAEKATRMADRIHKRLSHRQPKLKVEDYENKLVDDILNELVGHTGLLSSPIIGNVNNGAQVANSSTTALPSSPAPKQKDKKDAKGGTFNTKDVARKPIKIVATGKSVFGKAKTFESIEEEFGIK
jgi:hypothetical protein